ncbi:prolyl 4-hydroxylase subunit alpha-2-like [Paramacrobiotus metropolitanus]|uniref:prolyl 4-hydroxylase subunit alpha-2-like n=1 Tax=Paramacrobiotus metropolitanus TaxID=2943436 RepID=UPI002445C044|nr:prolyl 4-hydroxylase subunit alpha-2-like [Paramacrobiotus metropolitanus]
MRRLKIFYGVLIIFSAFDLHYVTAEVFASMADVETLINTEKLVLGTLQNLLQQERQKLAEALRYTKQIRNGTSNGSATAIASDELENPVKMFQTLKQHSSDFSNVIDSASADTFTDRNRSIQKLRMSRAFPDKEDIEGNADAFARLQLTYRIHPQDIARGRIPGTRPTMPFTSREAFIIGHNQAGNKYFNSAAAWLQVALEIYHEEVEKTGDLPEILDWLQYAIYQDTGNAVRALEITRQVQELDPTYPSLQTNINFYEEAIPKLTDEELAVFRNAPDATEAFDTNSLDYVNETNAAYEALCRGEERLTPAQTRELKCYYETHGNPYLLIQPVKVEMLSKDPEIFVLHNVIFDSQADRIRKVGYDHLMRGRVMDGKEARGSVSKVRIAKIAFLTEAVDPVIAEVNRYIGHATNLDINIAEDLQINNYGIGGHYSVHYDFFTNLHDLSTTNGPVVNFTNWGDRIATFLAYMTDVEAGGATVFPRINLTLFPEKGSAAFWYNKFKDGQPDPRTLHAGCPVLSGIKWVSNKWIREHGQDRQRPCGLAPDGFEDLIGVLDGYGDGY